MSLVLTQWLQVLPRATVAAPRLEPDSEANSPLTLHGVPAQVNQPMNDYWQWSAMQNWQQGQTACMNTLSNHIS